MVRAGPPRLQSKGGAVTSVAVVGHLCVDITPGLPGPPVLEPGVLVQVGPAMVQLGGALANTGRTLALLGVPVVAWGAIGRDDFGRIVSAHLARIPGFEFRPQVVDEATGYTVVVEPPGSDRTFWHHPGANASLRLGEVVLDDVDLLHFGYPSLMPAVCADSGAELVSLLSRAAGRGIVTSLDLSWVDPATTAGEVDWEGFLRRALPVTDVVTPSWDDLASAFRLPGAYDPERARRMVEQLLDWGAGVVMLTAGSEGALLGVAGAARLERLRRFPIDAVAWARTRAGAPARPLARVGTTTGAGDAATAGLLAALRSGRGPQEALDVALGVAAAVIEQGGTGAFTGLPAEA
jgi:sugar/nucleoside kinase (ribokinase family)